jgi:hypothetical protein
MRLHRRRPRIVAGLLLAVTVCSCSSAAIVDPDDDGSSNIPLTILPVTQDPAFSFLLFIWIPEEAQSVRVYRGNTAGNGPQSPDIMWAVTGTSRNGISAAIDYGGSQGGSLRTEVAARPLLPGTTYTLEVIRLDPRIRDTLNTTSGSQQRATRAFVPVRAFPAP